MKKKLWLIKKLEGYSPNTTALIPIYDIIGYTSKLSILHLIALLNRKWKDNGFAGVPFVTEEVSPISAKKLQGRFEQLHQYETC